MIQQRRKPAAGGSASLQFMNGTELIRHIIKTEGIGGFYRGFFTSILTYAPSSAVWWSTYSAVKSAITDTLLRVFPTSWSTSLVGIDGERHSRTAVSESANLLLSGISGFTAGCVSAVMTNPMDVVKTRVQTQIGGSVSGSEFSQLKATVRRLHSQEGWKGFTRGMGARMLNMGPVSVMMIVTYEVVKVLSVKP
ncbi:mitochondrial carrier domain-containing protein [Zopfochytrium polystomum]|nr:mitochondrial carrier domain-containing protein [Zopfochytrium polystomum]